MKLGAYDYVQKPFEIEEMRSRSRRRSSCAGCRTRSTTSSMTSGIYDFDRIVGNERRLQVLDVVRKVAKSNPRRC